eukprot:CAMPEP_0198587566 /NCGR_PEP_ID=MMETSP1462-20131121/132020_1 /TAXON_ID=1333877 /ORGANISM="Brandtodinium nutriculum, Strain RCC3387" /LENGTH=59 /DNA_ID=CAMNT_0044319049 /DNA_START=1 /DNA_END=177 /DNA_ORIENTATION=-
MAAEALATLPIRAEEWQIEKDIQRLTWDGNDDREREIAAESLGKLKATAAIAPLSNLLK